MYGNKEINMFTEKLVAFTNLFFFVVDTALLQGVKKFFNMQKVFWPTYI